MNANYILFYIYFIILITLSRAPVFTMAGPCMKALSGWYSCKHNIVKLLKHLSNSDWLK